MKKMSFENIKNTLTRNEMKKIMAGSNSDCIEDGKSCGLITACCNECLPSFNCGKKQH